MATREGIGPQRTAMTKLKKQADSKRVVKDLPVNADGPAIKGGNLFKACATGEHIKEATITH